MTPRVTGRGHCATSQVQTPRSSHDSPPMSKALAMPVSIHPRPHPSIFPEDTSEGMAWRQRPRMRTLIHMHLQGQPLLASPPPQPPQDGRQRTRGTAAAHLLTTSSPVPTLCPVGSDRCLLSAKWQGFQKLCPEFLLAQPPCTQPLAVTREGRLGPPRTQR